MRAWYLPYHPLGSRGRGALQECVLAGRNLRGKSTTLTGCPRRCTPNAAKAPWLVCWVSVFENSLWPQIGADEDVQKAKDSRNIRRGKGKMRNRRYVGRKGPLVVYGDDSGIAKAFRNLPGVDVLPVTALNILQVWVFAFH